MDDLARLRIEYEREVSVPQLMPKRQRRLFWMRHWVRRTDEFGIFDQYWCAFRSSLDFADEEKAVDLSSKDATSGSAEISTTAGIRRTSDEAHRSPQDVAVVDPYESKLSVD